MRMLYVFVVVCILGSVSAHQNQAGYGQNLPPGVNPSVYQDQHQGQPPPQYQQPHQHQAPPPQQGHRPPPPQQGHPPPHQQGHPPPPQQGHPPPHQQGHPPPHQQGHPHQKQQRPLHAQNIHDEKEHIKDHMDVPVDTSNMSEQELQFHYFKMHDADNNNKLDGTELVKSLIHWHDASNHDPAAGHQIPEQKIFTDVELTTMIDPILKQDDRNEDGFIDYAEFQIAQSNAAAKDARA